MKLKELLEIRHEEFSEKISEGEKMMKIIEDQQKAIKEMEELLSCREDSIKKIKNGGENLNRNLEIMEIKLKTSIRM